MADEMRVTTAAGPASQGRTALDQVRELVFRGLLERTGGPTPEAPNETPKTSEGEE